MVNKLDNALWFQQQTLNLRAYRQQVLAANIANADTPHYQARDLDFSSALQAAVAGRGEAGLALARTAPGHIAIAASADPTFLKYRQPTQASADGNTVEMDVERAQFADNSLHYEAGLTFLTHQIRTLLTALQGQ